ncbi:hypothetical protein BDZ97DRAFT_1926890 [Flammula alnicola]|nr:hypothetical protein BDZ97DRAFT_1926890 [Flammula alnicola]
MEYSTLHISEASRASLDLVRISLRSYNGPHTTMVQLTSVGVIDLTEEQEPSVSKPVSLGLIDLMEQEPSISEAVFLGFINLTVQEPSVQQISEQQFSFIDLTADGPVEGGEINVLGNEIGGD